MMNWFSTWSVIKSAGFTSYLLLFLSVSLGMFSYGKLVKPNIRAVLLTMHQLSGWLGFLFGVLHGVVLTIDEYQPFSYKAVFVPFTADYRPLASGLGTVALYLFFIILVTSDWMKTFGRKAWRAVHYLAFPSFILALVHGLTAGSDSKTLWILLFYSTTAVLFLLFVIFRIVYGVMANQEKQQATAPNHEMRKSRANSKKGSASS